MKYTATTSQSPGGDLVAQLAERIGARANASTIFGDAVSRGGVTVVPVARMSFGFGGGAGKDAQDQGEGGGGGAIVRPMGFLHLTDQTVRFRPIRDPRWLAALVGIGLLVLARLIHAVAVCRTSRDATIDTTSASLRSGDADVVPAGASTGGSSAG